MKTIISVPRIFIYINMRNLYELLQSISPGAVKTELGQASEMPKEIMEAVKDVPFLESKDVADAVSYVLGTPAHVQVYNTIDLVSMDGRVDDHKILEV
jgi:hypothetical protein